ncbi:MAG: 50S ribosomal protein L29 [Gammaproteobacteria bacterium]|nr:50S ribosomal protein L29 [Gammaproteobacteria bacterium]
MDIEDIRDMTDQQIREQLDELREERFRLKFRAATMELENPRLLSQLRRDIARVRTVQRERELAAALALTEENAP